MKKKKHDRDLIGEPLLPSPGDESPLWFWVFIVSIFLGMIFFLTWLAPEVRTPGFMKTVLHSVWIEPLAP